MKAATAACSCLTVAPPHLAEPRRDLSLAAFPKATDITRNASDFPFSTNLRTRDHAPITQILAASSSGPVGQRPILLGSANLVDAAMGFETSVRTSETIQLPPSPIPETLAKEMGSASAPEPAAARHAIHRLETVTGTAAEGMDALHGAVKIAPAECLECRPRSADFDMFYLARASGDAHRAPVTMSAAKVPDESKSARPVSNAQLGQRPIVLGSATFVDAATGFETSVRPSETTRLPPSPIPETLAMEMGSASAPEPAAARHAIGQSDTVTGTATEGMDAMHGAVKIAPAECLECRPRSADFDMFYLARASGDAHREPVTMPAAKVPDESKSARPVSNAQPPVDISGAESGTRSMDEPDLSLSPPGAQIRSLQQALSRTYQTNPTLMARRAELRGLDNAVALERAAGNLQISAGSTFGQEVYITRPLGSRGRTLRSNVDFSKILFAGGRIRNATRSAQTRVMAGRADLRATEGDILTEAVAAYADLLRDREIRDLNESQVRILLANLESTRDRFRVRDLTLTDVAQSETRLEVARSNLVTAEGRLQASEENFERIVGARAGNLEPLPTLPPLPLSSELAAETALANNASIAAFAARARAADYDVAVSRASQSPTLSVISSVDNNNALGTANSASGLPPGTAPNSETNIVAGFSVRIPLYQGGAASARVRQGEEIRSQFIEEAVAVERRVLADARTAFSIWRSATSSISFNEQAVASSGKALESVKFEQTVGARSILDVLNAEQEFLNSKIALTSARRDAYVAAFELLNSMGASEAADLNFAAGPLYDPKVNYREYSDTWSDWKYGSPRSPASTRNVPAETDSPLTRLNNGTLEKIEPDD